MATNIRSQLREKWHKMQRYPHAPEWDNREQQKARRFNASGLFFLFFQSFNELLQVDTTTKRPLKILPSQLDSGEPITAIRALSPPQNGGGARSGVYAAHVGPFTLRAYHNRPPLFGEQGQTSGPAEHINCVVPPLDALLIFDIFRGASPFTIIGA